ncbi:MAG TPA: dienelactone hydrolase family protein, partial [Fimbriimonas sp.]|nr:dienelactone hydrolase family protein [Fimbriimonas sp.]
PATHDWKKYGAVLQIPSGTTSMTIALEMYGPGTVWLDDVDAEFAPADTPLRPAVEMKEGDADPLADVKDVPNIQATAGHDPDKKYFVIGPKAGSPKDSYKLLVILPGGDGSADFNPFIRRVWKNALSEDFIVAELVAPKWDPDQFNHIVWPTDAMRYDGMKFSTEQFVADVVKDVSKKYKIDPKKVFAFGWSSGGPATYSAGLSEGPIKGSFIAMSVFHPNQLPPLIGGQDKPFYILHSPDDQLIPLSQAQDAETELKKVGGKVKLVSYPGGHGFTAGAFEMIQAGIRWLDQQTSG